MCVYAKLDFVKNTSKIVRSNVSMINKLAKFSTEIKMRNILLKNLFCTANLVYSDQRDRA